MKVIRENCNDKNPITIQFCCTSMANFCAEHSVLFHFDVQELYMTITNHQSNNHHIWRELELTHCHCCGAKLEDWTPDQKTKKVPKGTDGS